MSPLLDLMREGIEKDKIKNTDIELAISYLFGIIRDVLLDRGEAWERLDVINKIKLQWFYFPQGIEFDGFQSRTTKICRLFKLKESISAYQYCVVNHRFSKSNKGNLQISLRCEDKTDASSFL